jgi:hypothetical protein
MDGLSRLFSDSCEGLQAGARPKATVRASYHPKPRLFTYLSVREEELWAGAGRPLAAASTVHGDGI